MVSSRSDVWLENRYPGLILTHRETAYVIENDKTVILPGASDQGVSYRTRRPILSTKSQGEGGGVLSCMGYIGGMCGLKGYGFSAILVINKVLSLADFGQFGHKQGMVCVV